MRACWPTAASFTITELSVRRSVFSDDVTVFSHMTCAPIHHTLALSAPHPPPACQCSHYGAYESSCDQDTGQCACRPGISGRHCDQCAAPELTFPHCGGTTPPAPTHLMPPAMGYGILWDESGVSLCEDHQAWC